MYSFSGLERQLPVWYLIACVLHIRVLWPRNAERAPFKARPRGKFQFSSSTSLLLILCALLCEKIYVMQKVIASSSWKKYGRMHEAWKICYVCVYISSNLLKMMMFWENNTIMYTWSQCNWRICVNLVISFDQNEWFVCNTGIHSWSGVVPGEMSQRVAGLCRQEATGIPRVQLLPHQAACVPPTRTC